MIVGLLLAVTVLLFTIGILGPWRDAPERKINGRLPRAIRMLLSLSLFVAALVIALTQPTVYSRWVAAGMFVCFIGDLIMARLIPMPNHLIGGMIAFGIAHGLYITAFIQAGGAALLNSGLFAGLGFYQVFAVVGWYSLIRNPQKEAMINIGALVYGMWIGVMASFGLGLAFATSGAYWLTALGGLIFVVSDFIIGITDIRGIHIKHATDWIWLTYVLGQMGIIYAGKLV